MDPVSLVLGAYLKTVQNTVHDALTEQMGTQVQMVSIEYEGMSIPFQYQMWRIREKSVCGTYADSMSHYSKCTIKAKELFKVLCSDIKSHNGWKQAKLKNMYCNASVSYKPTVASIGLGSEESPLQIAKKKCNNATVAAMGSRNRQLISERNKLCDEYREFKK